MLPEPLMLGMNRDKTRALYCRAPTYLVFIIRIGIYRMARSQKVYKSA
jgi:hypothetical protein